MKKLKVPLAKQKEKQTCGPAALKMVLHFYGQRFSETKIKNKIGGTKRSYGVRTTKLAKFARSLGYNVKCFSYNKKMAEGEAEIKIPSEKDITTFLKKGVPVVLAVNSSVLFDRKKFQTKGTLLF
ncbi:MAG: C39 family peptidase [archaeon]